MTARSLTTDYLVIGAGAAGMAFTDSLITESDAQVVMVDRRAAPGGHWNDAYPFVRLHQPSNYYGVNSMPLGDETIQQRGPEAGLYARATGTAIRAYYERVMQERLLATGQVRFLPQCEHAGEGRIVSRLTGDVFEVEVRRKVVDATYLAPAIPARTAPGFEVAPDVACVPVNQLGQLSETPERFVIIGAGKTALDACVWLLESGVDPERIRWIKPREAWLLERRFTQPGELAASLLTGLALQMEAAAFATSADDLFDRLEASEQMVRVDTRVRPSMYKGATIGRWEIDLLRRIEDVVRLGHVRRIERDRIVLERGEVPTSPRSLHVHCAADGLRRPPPLPIFAPGRITLQPVRSGLIPFNAALVAFVEAHREDDAEKNRLCPTNPFMHVALDWARTMLIQLQADRAWTKEADIAAWLDRSRLNASCGLRERLGDPAVQQALKRFSEHAGPGTARLRELLQQAGAPARTA